MLKFFKFPFAITGTRSTVPPTDPATGEVNYPTGYPGQYALPKTDPTSRNIERDKFNQLMFDITNELQLLQANGAPDFITTALNEGSPFEYGVGAVVRYDDGVNGPRLFESRVAANTDLPTVAASWRPLRPSGLPVAIAGGTANDLTAAFVPSLGLVPDGTTFLIRHAAANTGAATLAVNGGPAKPIVKSNNVNLQAADIPGAASWGIYAYDLTLDKYVLLAVTGLPAANTAEAQAGTANNRTITPLSLREGLNAAGSAPVYAPRAWVNFNGTGVVAIRAAGNVSSILDNGTGDYTANITVAMPDADYAVPFSVGHTSLNVTSGLGQDNVRNTKTATAFRFGTYYSGAGDAKVLADAEQVGLVFVR